jgi:23S rRNA pseudouridine1911/1915/1917 synthase
VEEQVLTLQYGKDGEQRLDLFLVEAMPDTSRARLQALIKEGRVLVDGKPAAKSGAKLESGMTVQVHIPPRAPAGLIGEDIPLDIVFENDDLAVINKPAGMVVHPAAGHQTGTLVHAMLGHAPDIEGIGGEDRPGVVHRLDKDTSGLILLAKNDGAHRWLEEQFRLRQVSKTYLALVDGKPPTPTGRVEAAIGRDPSHRKQMAIVTKEKGREAVSEYKTLESFPSHTLLEFHPLTGRTHQIRVHCAFLGCPIVGDRVYGHKQPSLPINRQFLHASRLRIRLPGDAQPSDFEASLPSELVAVLEALREQATRTW